MSREVRRVPLDFAWPLKTVWDGYLTPERLRGKPCPDCESGYSPQAQYFHDQWYGKAPFDPASTGSEPLTPATPAVRAFAERQCSRTPDFYGTGETAIIREAERLCRMWNRQWNHHLAQEDVDALVEAGRLHDLTHIWSRETGWVKKDPPATLTPTLVNEWNILTFGHDSINSWVVIEARCKREGVSDTCSTCQGHASVERYPGQRADAEKWAEEDHEPPTGEGWQLWETVSQGSPITPVFASADALSRHLVEVLEFNPGAARTLVEQGSSIGTFVGTGNTLLDSAKDADVVAALGNPDAVFTEEDLAAAVVEHGHPDVFGEAS